MQAHFRRMSRWTDEEMRAMRLARGLRAVAATVIIGGIVIAAFDTAPTTKHEISRDVIAGPSGSAPISALLFSAAPSTPASRQQQPASDRIEPSMEHR